MLKNKKFICHVISSYNKLEKNIKLKFNKINLLIVLNIFTHEKFPCINQSKKSYTSFLNPRFSLWVK